MILLRARVAAVIISFTLVIGVSPQKDFCRSGPQSETTWHRLGFLQHQCLNWYIHIYIIQNNWLFNFKLQIEWWILMISFWCMLIVQELHICDIYWKAFVLLWRSLFGKENRFSTMWQNVLFSLLRKIRTKRKESNHLISHSRDEVKSRVCSSITPSVYRFGGRGEVGGWYGSAFWYPSLHGIEDMKHLTASCSLCKAIHIP